MFLSPCGRVVIGVWKRLSNWISSGSRHMGKFDPLGLPICCRASWRGAGTGGSWLITKIPSVLPQREKPPLFTAGTRSSEGCGGLRGAPGQIWVQGGKTGHNQLSTQMLHGLSTPSLFPFGLLGWLWYRARESQNNHSDYSNILIDYPNYKDMDGVHLFVAYNSINPSGYKRASFNLISPIPGSVSKA